MDQEICDRTWCSPEYLGTRGCVLDNTGAIAQSKEPRAHHRSKHILRKFHLIREILQRKDVIIEKIDTDRNVADPFTKPLSQAKHDYHAKAIGLRYLEEDES